MFGPAPKCNTCKVNEASFDNEPGAEGYFSNCEVCTSLNHQLAPHEHTMRWWPAYLAAHPEADPNHTWPTIYPTHAVYCGGVLVARQCTRCEEIMAVEWREGARVNAYLLQRPTTPELVASIPFGFR